MVALNRVLQQELSHHRNSAASGGKYSPGLGVSGNCGNWEPLPERGFLSTRPWWCPQGLVPHHPCASLGQEGPPPPSQPRGHQTLRVGPFQWHGDGGTARLGQTGTTPDLLSLSGRFYTPTPPNGLCFVSFGSNKTRRQKNPTYQPPVRHLCLALCGLWFQPHKATSPGNGSKTAPAPSPARPAHPPAWHHGPQIPQSVGSAGPHRSLVRAAPTALAQLLPRLVQASDTVKWWSLDGASPKKSCEKAGEDAGSSFLLPLGATWP